jgi:hypothetical protein
VRLHAIYAAFEDAQLFAASVRSVYDHVDRITVTTNHDRDWRGAPRAASPITALVLSRELDPERKIDLIVTAETNEARSRNRAMDHAAPRPASWHVRREHARDPEFAPPDWFLVVDEDEVWSGDDLERAKAYVRAGGGPVYRTACERYFKRWNYRVTGLEWLVTFVRADIRLPYLRTRRAALPRRALARVPGMPHRARGALRGFHDIPADVATFHHGSYVGPRERIAAKVQAWGHAGDVTPGWLTDVYDPWTPSARDFNPVYRGSYDAAVEVPVGELPREIAEHPWSAEYLEPR